VIAFAFYLRIIVVMYMQESDATTVVVPGTIRWVLAAAVVTTIIWGVLPGSLLDLAADALPL
jgi:NADH:ubiquinone oxidoreductase subunit 2 (subunit N)